MMTDNEIIKALEYCYGSNEGSCNDCPQFKHKDGCVTMNDALAVINRQKAEIERLKGFNENLQTANTCLSNEILDIKFEAIKEFAERLKHNLEVLPIIEFTFNHVMLEIDNLVKEMERESNAE